MVVPFAMIAYDVILYIITDGLQAVIYKDKCWM